VAETAIRVVPADGFVCHQGNSDDHWLVVLDGLVKVASVPLEGKSMSFVGSLGDFFSMVKYERSLAPNASLAKRVGGAVQSGAVSG